LRPSADIGLGVPAPVPAPEPPSVLPVPSGAKAKGKALKAAPATAAPSESPLVDLSPRRGVSIKSLKARDTHSAVTAAYNMPREDDNDDEHDPLMGFSQPRDLPYADDDSDDEDNDGEVFDGTCSHSYMYPMLIFRSEITTYSYIDPDGRTVLAPVSPSRSTQFTLQQFHFLIFHS